MKKKILYFDLLGMCPQMKMYPQLNFYVKTILCQCSFSKKSSTL